MITYFKKNVDISLDKIELDYLTNPRQEYDDEHINSLAQSIYTLGQQQAICVYPLKDNKKFGLIWGFCRYKAMELLSKQYADSNTIKADILDPSVKIGDLLLLNLQENVVRKQLTPYEEAKAIEQLQDHKTQEEICSALGWSKSLYTQRSKILSYSDTLQQAIQYGLPVRSASIIDELPEELHDKYIDIAMTTSIVKLREMIDEHLNSGEDKRQPIDLSDIELTNVDELEEHEDNNDGYIETPTISRAGELRDLLLELLSQTVNSSEHVLSVQSIDFTRLLQIDQDRLLSVLNFLATDDDADDVEYEEVLDEDDDDL